MLVPRYNNNSLFFLVILAVFLAGCATMTVKSDYVDSAKDFSKLKTYAWTSESQSNELVSEEADQWIRQDVDSALRAKGYQKDSLGTPDFGVDYHVTIAKKEEKLNIAPPYSPISTGRGGVQIDRTWESLNRLQGMNTIRYEEGTLILDIKDPSTQELLWRGSVSAVVDRGASPEKRKAKLNKAVEKLLAQFPPK